MANNPIALHLVNLSVQNETIPTYWYQIKHHIKGLYIRDGNIREIQSNAFNTAAFKRLQHLELDGLALKHINSGIFNGLFSLKVLIIRNLNLYTFEPNAFIPNQNPVKNNLNQYFDQHQSFSSGYSMWNHSSTYFETFYLTDNIGPSTPWIVLKNLPVIITTAFISSIFSFYVSFKISFVLLQVFRTIQRKVKRFIRNVENDAAAMFAVQNDIEIYRLPVRKIRKLRFCDLYFLLKRKKMNEQVPSA